MDQQPVVIITGSSGLIGSAVCNSVARAGYRTVGFDRPGRPHPPPSALNVPCDVTSDESVSDALDLVRRNFGNRIASVIHLAAYYDFSGEPSPLYEQVTVAGTRRLLRSLMPFAVEQFIFSSTMLVHAPCQPGQHVSEESPLEPRWAYPESKFRTEQVIRQEHGSIPAAILRIAGVYTDRCQSIPLAHQIQRIYERRLTANVFPGDTSTGQSFVHLEDLERAFMATLAGRANIPRESVVLIGEPEPVSYEDLQRTFARLIHGDPGWKTIQIPKAVAKAGAWVQDTIPGVEEPFIKPWMIDLADDHYALNIARARTLLNWAPRRHLRDTLPRMIEALKADPSNWYRENKLAGAPPLPVETAGRRTT